MTRNIIIDALLVGIVALVTMTPEGAQSTSRDQYGGLVHYCSQKDGLPGASTETSFEFPGKIRFVVGFNGCNARYIEMTNVSKQPLGGFLCSFLFTDNQRYTIKTVSFTTVTAGPGGGKSCGVMTSMQGPGSGEECSHANVTLSCN